MQGSPPRDLVAHRSWASTPLHGSRDWGESMRTVEIVPKPSSLVESLRDIGYSLGTALADIIDNSLAAGARTVQIFASVPGGDEAIGILDDGVGLAEAELLEAMLLGSRSPLEETDQSDLGLFTLLRPVHTFSTDGGLTTFTRLQPKIPVSAPAPRFRQPSRHLPP